jgi:hypothetical protein
VLARQSRELELDPLRRYIDALKIEWLTLTICRQTGNTFHPAKLESAKP